jgi:hypothetical protein
MKTITGKVVKPRSRWKDNIKMDLGEIQCRCGGWIQMAQDRIKWPPLMNRMTNLQVS